MPRASIAGATDYSHQSFEDMVSDLEYLVQRLKRASRIFDITIKKLKKVNYWDKVDIDFQCLLAYATKFHETSIQEISEILSEIQDEVRPDHITRIDRLGKTAIELNIDYGKVWHQQYQNKEYGNKDFKLVETLYGEGRQMAVDMIDLRNLVKRLQDFIGKKTKPKQVKQSFLDIIKLEPNWFGIGLNLKKLIARKKEKSR